MISLRRKFRVDKWSDSPAISVTTRLALSRFDLMEGDVESSSDNQLASRNRSAACKSTLTGWLTPFSCTVTPNSLFMRLMVIGWWAMTRQRVPAVRAISSIMAQRRSTLASPNAAVVPGGSVASYNAMRYGNRMIRSFARRETALIWSGRRSRKLPSDIQAAALRKLRILNQARVLEDLRVPPGNRLEALKGNRAGQHSIRINDQWRICFVWNEGGANDVEIVDYH